MNEASSLESSPRNEELPPQLQHKLVSRKPTRIPGPQLREGLTLNPWFNQQVAPRGLSFQKRPHKVGPRQLAVTRPPALPKQLARSTEIQRSLDCNLDLPSGRESKSPLIDSGLKPFRHNVKDFEVAGFAFQSHRDRRREYEAL